MKRNCASFAGRIIAGYKVPKHIARGARTFRGRRREKVLKTHVADMPDGLAIAV